jgi:multidrug efflux pump
MSTRVRSLIPISGQTIHKIINAAFRGRGLLVAAHGAGRGRICLFCNPERSQSEELPFFHVSTGLDGISPTDAERLLLELDGTEFDNPQVFV